MSVVHPWSCHCPLSSLAFPSLVILCYWFLSFHSFFNFYSVIFAVSFAQAFEIKLAFCWTSLVSVLHLGPFSVNTWHEHLFFFFHISLCRSITTNLNDFRGLNKNLNELRDAWVNECCLLYNTVYPNLQFRANYFLLN